MNVILRMMEKWDQFHQCFFMFMTLGLVLLFALHILRYGVILIRGWPKEERR